MADKLKLLQDFYAKYAPDVELTEDRIKAIDAKYGDNTDLLLKDFYAKYASDVELNQERISAINEKYGLKKKESTVSVSSVSPSPSAGGSSLSPSFDKNWNATIKKAEEQKKVEQKKVEATKKKEADKQAALDTPAVIDKPKSFTEMITTSYASDVNRKTNQADNTTIQPAVKGYKSVSGRMVPVVEKRPLQTPAIEKYAGQGAVWKEADLTEIPTLIQQEGYKQFVAPLFKTIGIIQSDINNRISYSIPGMMMEIAPTKIEDYAAYKFGKAVDYWAENIMYPVSDQTKESTIGQFTSGATSLGGFAVLGSLGAATGVGSIALPSLFGAMLNGSQEYERAYDTTLDAQNLSDQEWYQKYTPGEDYEQAIAKKQEMANNDPDQVAFDTWMGASVIGLSEGLPVMAWMSKINKSTDGLFAKAMAKYLKEGLNKSTLQGAVEEGLQESMAQLFSNLNAIQVYDKTREISEGVAESGTMGFLLGGALHGMTSAIQSKLADPSLPAGERAIYENTLAELEAKQEETKDVKPDEVIKPFDDPENIAELKKKKIELELDFADTTTPDDIKQVLEAKIAEVDAQIEEARVGNQETAVTEMAKVGETAELEDSKAKLETQIESSTPATQEVLAPALEIINTELNATELDKSIAQLENAIAEDDLSLQTKGQATMLPNEKAAAQAQLETLKQQQAVANATPEVQPIQADIQQKVQETEAKIKRKDLFEGVGSFSKKLGGSDVESVPTNHTEKNGVEYVEYSNPKTGEVDIVITGKSDNNSVGYYRIYENGKPTNKWSSKIETDNKQDFKEMVAGVQSLLPPGHEYTETTSISTDGLRIWEQQLNRGYELQHNKDGNVVTNRVAINKAAKVNELGIPVQKGFGKLLVTNQENQDKVKQALLPYLKKLGLNENNIHITNGIVEIDLPILKSNPKAQVKVKAKAEPVAKAKEEGEFVVQGTFNGDQVIAGNKEYKVKDYRQIGQRGETKLEENIKGDKKIFTLVSPNKDAFGRRGYMGVSLVLPSTTTKTNAEIEEILKKKTEEVKANLSKERSGSFNKAVDMKYQDAQKAEVVKPTEKVAPVKAEKVVSVKEEKTIIKEPAVVEEPTVQEEVAEEYTPLTKKGVTVGKFTKDEAVDYEEDEKELDSGRMSTYISSLTVDVVDDETTGDSVGHIIKLKDEDNNVSWQAEDVDGMELSEFGFDTQAEALDAVLKAHNKTNKKEFDKEQKKIAKQKTKEMEKRAKAADKVASSLKSAGIKVKFVSSEQMDKERQKRGGTKGAEGVFLSDSGEVLIDRDNFEEGWGTTVVWHEGIHPILNIIRNTNPELYNAAVRGLKMAVKASPKSGLGNVLNWATKQYAVDSESTVNDEGLTESMARIADGKINLDAIPKSAKQAVIDFINKIAKALGLGQIINDTDMAKFKKLAGDIASVLTEGRDIAEVVGKENVGKYVSSIGGAQKSAVRVMQGKENMAKYGLKGNKAKTREVGEALEERQRQKYGIIGKNDRSPEAKKKISSWMMEEIEYFIEAMGENSGKGWYGEKYQKGLDAMAEIFPEMKKDQNARDLFTMLVAITSDGEKVLSNFKLAALAYSGYIESGKKTVPSSLPGMRQASFSANLSRINSLLKQYKGDIQAMKKDLLEVKSIRDINAERKVQGEKALTTSWPVDFNAPLAASVFGPKLGMFYSNLSGKEDYPTLDRWWSRTFNRYRGNVIPQIKRGFNTKGEPLGIDRIKALLKKPKMSDDNAMIAIINNRDSYAAKGFKRGTELEKAANTVYKTAFENLNDSPENKTDRQFMYDTVADAVERLNAKGYDLSIADAQAILWYFEKNLYKTLGVQAKIEGISYEDAARITVQKFKENNSLKYNIDENEDQDQIEEEDDNIEKTEDSVQESKAGGREDLQRTEKGINFETDETRKTKQTTTPAGFKVDRPVAGVSSRLDTKSGGPRGFKRRDTEEVRRIGADDVKVSAIYTPEESVKKGILKFNKDATIDKEILEISNDPEAFHKFISQAKFSNPNGASVYVYEDEQTREHQYDDMRLFVTPDGEAGVALKPNGDMVSGFASVSKTGVKKPYRIAQLLVLAIKEGALKADAFNTALPGYYSRFGFRGVAKSTFNEDYAPAAYTDKYGNKHKAWEKEQFKDYQDGLPDVVYFVYDGGDRNTIENRLGAFEPYKAYEDIVPLVGDPDEGAVLQAKALGAKPQESQGNRGETAMVDGVEEKVKPLPGGIDIVDGFYSPLEKKIAEFKQPNASANKWKEILGTKSDEAQFSGLADWLNSKRPDEQVKKAEIQQFIKDNRIEIKEIVKENVSESDIKTFMEDEAGEGYTREEAIEQLQSGEATKFKSYTLPGNKEDYRETLVTLPNRTKENLVARVADIDKEIDNLDIRLYEARESENKEGVAAMYVEKRKLQDERSDTFDKIKEEKEGEFYERKHYDEADILVHTRTDVRYDSNGNKILFVEEIQSDWGQTGKRDGFKGLTDAEIKKTDQIKKEQNEILNGLETYQLLKELTKDSIYSMSQGHEADKVHTLVEVIEFNISNVTSNRYYDKSDPEDVKRGKERMLKGIDDSIRYWFKFSDQNVKISDTDKLRLIKAYENDAKSGVSKMQEKDYNVLDALKKFKELKTEQFKTTLPNASRIKTAPYVQKTNAWAKLGLKVALKEAVAAGAKSIAWTTGEQQIARYDLRKQADRVSYKQNADGTYDVNASKEGVSVGNEQNLTPKQLEGALGKDIAQRIVAGEGDASLAQGMQKDLTGEQLAFGGAGMIGFYGNETKPGIIGETAIALVEELTGKKGEIKEVKIATAEGMSTQASIEITPALEASVKQGMPQFSKGGRDVQSTFAQATDLFYQIRETEGGAKKRRLADERKALMDANPSVKYIDDNIKNIIDQLEKNNKATRKGNCP